MQGEGGALAPRPLVTSSLLVNVTSSAGGQNNTADSVRCAHFNMFQVESIHTIHPASAKPVLESPAV